MMWMPQEVLLDLADFAKPLRQRSPGIPRRFRRCRLSAEDADRDARYRAPSARKGL